MGISPQGLEDRAVLWIEGMDEGVVASTLSHSVWLDTRMSQILGDGIFSSWNAHQPSTLFLFKAFYKVSLNIQNVSLCTFLSAALQPYNNHTVINR